MIQWEKDMKEAVLAEDWELSDRYAQLILGGIRQVELCDTHARDGMGLGEGVPELGGSLPRHSFSKIEMDEEMMRRWREE